MNFIVQISFDMLLVYPYILSIFPVDIFRMDEIQLQDSFSHQQRICETFHFLAAETISDIPFI